MKTKIVKGFVALMGCSLLIGLFALAMFSALLIFSDDNYLLIIISIVGISGGVIEILFSPDFINGWPKRKKFKDITVVPPLKQ